MIGAALLYHSARIRLMAPIDDCGTVSACFSWKVALATAALASAGQISTSCLTMSECLCANFAATAPPQLFPIKITGSLLCAEIAVTRIFITSSSPTPRPRPGAVLGLEWKLGSKTRKPASAQASAQTSHSRRTADDIPGPCYTTPEQEKHRTKYTPR